MRYDPHNWYWRIAETANQVWSSAHQDYVAEDDADYVAWVAAGGVATPIAFASELYEVLQTAAPALATSAAVVTQLASLSDAREIAKARIDAAAEDARLAYITAGDGQAMVYDRKEKQARDCLANHDAQNPPPAGNYPALDNEIGITGADTLEVADAVVATAGTWAVAADPIEAARLGGKQQVDAAAGPAEIDAAVDTALDAFTMIKDQ